VLIIPPIPSKQSITDYAVKGQSKTKEDTATIARRKRLLEDFLRRIVRHPILGGDHVFHRFLEEGVSWVRLLDLIRPQLTAERGPALASRKPPPEEPASCALAQPDVPGPR
jgi:hypothetical protein